MKTTNKRKNKKRKLLLVLLMLLLTFVTLSTSTYAWFTANKTVTVSSINVNVAATNGLQISVNAIEWKTIITNEDIQKVIDEIATDPSKATYPSAVNQLPNSSSMLSPVSTIGNVTDGKMDMFLGTVSSDASGNLTLTAEQSVETSSKSSGNFVAFDLFFQVQSQTDIYLTSNSSVTSGENNNTGIHNAGRVAFIDEGYLAAGSNVANIQALKEGKNVVIWEPNTDVHTAAAVNAAYGTYQLTTKETGADRLEYYGVKAAIGTGVALNSTDAQFFQKVTPTLTSVAAGIPTNAYLKVLTLNPGITKVRVDMWVEGQDVDCENNASGGSVSYNIQFSMDAGA